MSTWNYFILGIVVWAAIAALFWPLLDFVLVRLGKIPPVKGCDIDTVKAIHSKGFWFRYSAFKRFRASKKQTFSQAYADYKSAVGS
jgi:hypothetical protein